jgi:hypothetical protein
LNPELIEVDVVSGFFASTEFPPSLADYPIFVMISIFGLLLGTLLAAQWMHRLVTDLCDDPLPWRHPLTMDRLVKILIIGGALSRSIPRLVQVMAWSKLSPYWREWLSLQNWNVNVLWALLFAAAWWIDRTAAPITSFQLRRWPTTAIHADLRGSKIRGAGLFLAVLLIAFVVTYVRPAQPYVDRPVSASE